MAAAAFLLLVLFVASGVAVGGDDGAGPPFLELRGIEDSGPGHVSDSDAPPQGQVIMDYLQFTHSCGRFAALVAATTNASDFFSQRTIAGTGGGLTVFCPEDLAVAAFEPKFNNLSADDQLAVVLLHGAAGCFGRKQLAAFDSVSVRTLAADAATNRSHVLTVRDDGETVWLWSSPPSRGSGGAARVTKEVPLGETPVALYVVDSVLLPDHLRQRLDGRDEVAACTLSGGYLGLLQCTVPMWTALCMTASGMLGIVTGVFIAEYFYSRREDAIAMYQ